MPFTCTVCVPVGCWVIGAAELGLDGYREEIESSIYILNIQDQIISFLSRHTINPKRSFNGVVPAKNQWYFCLLLTTFRSYRTSSIPRHTTTHHTNNLTLAN